MFSTVRFVQTRIEWKPMPFHYGLRTVSFEVALNAACIIS